MAQIKLLKSALVSREIRKKIGGTEALRKITTAHGLTKPKNLGQQLLDFGAGFFNGIVGFASGIFKGLGWAGGIATAVWNWLVGRINQLKAFNWNATDAELEKMIQAQNATIAAVWGSTLGNAFGWIAGIGIGYGISFLCPVIGGAALAKGVATAVGKEALEEVTSGLTNAFVSTAGALANQAMISTYINYRKLIKNLPVEVLEKIWGKEDAKYINQVWGKEGAPDASFNKQMDDTIESIKDPNWKIFIENFLEEAWDSFCEAGYIAAHEIDSAYAQAKAANQQKEGKKRIVKLQPRKESNEVFVLQGNQTTLQTEVQNILTQTRVVGNRDLGVMVGQPAEEYQRAKPHRRKLTVVFKTIEKPPFTDAKGKQARQFSYDIPDVKMGLSWQQIKQACKKFTWGKFRATANLDNGRQMAVHGNSKQEAEKKLKELAALTTAKISSMTVTETDVVINPKLKKDPIIAYPCYATLLVRRPSVDATGYTDLEGNTFDEEHQRIDLWMSSAPPGYVPLK